MRDTVKSVTEKTDKQKEKDEELQRRKEELEEELERYSRAGIVSPGLLKAARWFSRILWMMMSALVVYLLYSGWGSVSKDQYETAVNRAIEIKKTADEAKDRLDEESSKRQVSEAKLSLTELELDELKHGRPAADRAAGNASDLVARAWGELAYAEHWRGKLKTDSAGDDASPNVVELIRQASRAPAAQAIELLGETAEFGRDAVMQGVDQALANPALQAQAARLAVWLGGEDMALSVKAKLGDNPAPELEFALSLLTHAEPTNGSHRAEAWVGYALRAYDVAQEALVRAYKDAPEERKLELLALLAEAAGLKDTVLFKSVATSDRPEAEKIIAVRWMGTRRDTHSRDLLKTLSEGRGALADEAKKALEKLDG